MGRFATLLWIAAVVAAAIQIGAQSDGAFDITVAPLVDLWGFGPSAARMEAEAPLPAKLTLWLRPRTTTRIVPEIL